MGFLKNRRLKKKAKHFVEDLQHEVQFSEEEFKALESVFQEHAEDGFVDVDGLADVLAETADRFTSKNMLWSVPPKALAEILMDSLDLDGNGLVDIEELLLGMNVFTEATPAQKGKWSFRLADKNGDGVLDVTELLHMVRTSVTVSIRLAPHLAEITAIQKHYSPEQAKKIRETADVYAREMTKQIPDITTQIGTGLFTRADADGDGVITAKEWKYLCDQEDFHDLMSGAKKPDHAPKKDIERLETRLQEAESERVRRETAESALEGTQDDDVTVTEDGSSSESESSESDASDSSSSVSDDDSDDSSDEEAEKKKKKKEAAKKKASARVVTVAAVEPRKSKAQGIKDVAGKVASILDPRNLAKKLGKSSSKKSKKDVVEKKKEGGKKDKKKADQDSDSDASSGSSDDESSSGSDSDASAESSSEKPKKKSSKKGRTADSSDEESSDASSSD